jgi:4-hydroxy-tetrahydrodipicolinate synthase
VPLINRLVSDLSQIKVLKHEHCPGLGKISRVRQSAIRENLRRISILVGNGALYYPLELGRGADGAMTGFAFPELLVEVYQRFVQGREEDAFELFDVYLPLIRYEQQPGIGLAVRKEILRRRGVIECATLRPPGAKLDALDLREVDRMLERLDRRIAAAAA